MAALADANRTTVVKLDALQEAARTRNIELSIHRVVSGAEIAAAIDMARESGAAALNVLASPMLYARLGVFDPFGDRIGHRSEATRPEDLTPLPGMGFGRVGNVPVAG